MSLTYYPGLKFLLFSVKFIKERKKRKEEIAFYFYSSSPVNFLKMSLFNFFLSDACFPLCHTSFSSTT